jgi:hypothetical protein
MENSLRLLAKSKKYMYKFLQKSPSRKYVTIVSGLPRSGTSMMMKMLEGGGLPPLTDNIRVADDDNPKGYYEFERVKKIPEGDTSWLESAQGKSVKVISALLKHLPPGNSYRVLFMQRNLGEILASQKQMLIRSGKPSDEVSDEKLAEMYGKHLAIVTTWLKEQPNFSVLYLDYGSILADPQKYADRVNQFLGNNLDRGEMAGVVDQELYRQRK